MGFLKIFVLTRTISQQNIFPEYDVSERRVNLLLWRTLLTLPYQFLQRKEI